MTRKLATVEVSTADYPAVERIFCALMSDVPAEDVDNPLVARQMALIAVRVHDEAQFAQRVVRQAMRDAVEQVRGPAISPAGACGTSERVMRTG